MRLTAVLFLIMALAGCLGAQNRPLQLVSGAGPTYPTDARSAGIEGDVVVPLESDVAVRAPSPLEVQGLPAPQ